jgi:hypothetical protein
MRRDDMRFAVVARDDGIRKIGKITWRVGAIAAACSAVIALAFGHHASAQSTSGGSSQTGGSGIQVPSQPPGPGQGSGHVTSGGTR